MTRVYPRVCGGTSASRRRLGRMKGLSPRVRGNRAITDDATGDMRSIPACAGEPLTTADPLIFVRVYPRVCGGTSRVGMLNFTVLGLSPRVRGNLGSPFLSLLLSRSIPACAGEPVSRMPATRESRVYPRVCGGTFASGEKRSICPGLSPRVRGNQSMCKIITSSSGSIPACAGEPLA